MSSFQVRLRNLTSITMKLVGVLRTFQVVSSEEVLNLTFTKEKTVPENVLFVMCLKSSSNLCIVKP